MKFFESWMSSRDELVDVDGSEDAESRKKRTGLILAAVGLLLLLGVAGAIANQNVGERAKNGHSFIAATRSTTADYRGHGTCPPGEYGSPGSCAQCPIGHKCPGGTNSVACPLGQYQGSAGQIHCVLASPGYFVPGRGMRAEYECNFGEYQPKSGQSSCVKASPGYHVFSTCGTSQQKCGVKEYQPCGGQFLCMPCPSYAPWGMPPSAPTRCTRHRAIIGRRYNPTNTSSVLVEPNGLNSVVGGLTASVDENRLADTPNEWSEKDSSALRAELKKFVTMLSVDEREAMASFWIDQGLGEHGSVASFAQNTLDLMALGAPPQLLLDAQRAGMDEVHHAQISFEIASVFAGRIIAPGMFPEHTVKVRHDWQSVAEDTAKYGAIEETVGAINMRNRAAMYRDVLKLPEVASYLEVLVEDELRHSQLAWDTLEWIGKKFGKESLANVLSEEWWLQHRGPTVTVSSCAKGDFDVTCLDAVKNVVNGTRLMSRDSLAWSHVVEPMARGLFIEDFSASVSVSSAIETLLGTQS